MLYSVDSGLYVTQVPHLKEYKAWKQRLPQADFDAIFNELHLRINGSEVETSS